MQTNLDVIAESLCEKYVAEKQAYATTIYPNLSLHGSCQVKMTLSQQQYVDVMLLSL